MFRGVIRGVLILSLAPGLDLSTFLLATTTCAPQPKATDLWLVSGKSSPCLCCSQVNIQPWNNLHLAIKRSACRWLMTLSWGAMLTLVLAATELSCMSQSTRTCCFVVTLGFTFLFFLLLLSTTLTSPGCQQFFALNHLWVSDQKTLVH